MLGAPASAIISFDFLKCSRCGAVHEVPGITYNGGDHYGKIYAALLKELEDSEANPSKL